MAFDVLGLQHWDAAVDGDPFRAARSAACEFRVTTPLGWLSGGGGKAERSIGPGVGDGSRTGLVKVKG
jgi:hypothetical protein